MRGTGLQFRVTVSVQWGCVHLENSLVAEEEVGRFQVPMENPVVVQMVDSSKELYQQRLHLPCSKHTTCNNADIVDGGGVDIFESHV